MSLSKRLDRLESTLNLMVAKSNPGLCSQCGTTCKTFNQEWFERTGKEVYDTCTNRYVVLYGEWEKEGWKQ